MTPSNPNPLKRGLNRGILLSGHCTGKSAVTPTLPSKRGLRATTTPWRNVSECADVKCSYKIEKGVRRGWDGTSSLPVFRTSSQRGPFKYSEKEPCHPREMGEVKPLRTEVWRRTHTFTSHTLYPTRAASGCHVVRFCCRRMGATLNSPTKGRVEVVQLNCSSCDTTINWRYPFLTGPERGFKSDSCKWIYMSFKN